MNQIKRLFSLSLIALVALSGCKKFVDVNQDKNQNPSTRADFVMTGAMGTTYRNQISTNVNTVPGTWTGVYAHSTSFTGGGNEKTYEYTPADFNAFAPLFDNLADYNYVIQHADADGFGFFKDPANVMQCYVYQELVDLYGDVPYTSSAFQGANNITPAYTAQKTIYEDLVVRLDSAMDRMVRTTWPTGAEVTVQDVYFGLNKARWLEFANTLKLRILMRQSFMPGRDAYITSHATTRLTNNFLSQNVLVQPGYVSIAGKLNPFYDLNGYNEINNVRQNYQYRKMNAVIINFLKNSGGSADTLRLQSLAYPKGSTFATSTDALRSITSGTNVVADYVGVPLGIGSGFATASSSPIGPFQIQVPLGTRAGMMMLLAESKFLQAEYTERYGVTFSGKTAQVLYEEGVRDHFRTIAAPSTAGTAANTVYDLAAARYVARLGLTSVYGTPTSFVNYTLSTNKIQTILIQKWLAFTHINGLEQWSDYRKANTTTLAVPSSTAGVPSSVRTVATTSNPEPVRYLYPQSEFDNNPANVPASINRFTSKIFWDVN